MQKIVVTGGARLAGEVRISGAKNAALPLMIASLLTDQTLILDNVPRLADVVVGIYLSSDRKRSAVAESFAAHFADAFLASSRDD